ncbi:MAG: hypothetical protein M0R73_00390 [Dehalococcoidia bacterium]|nr:hypothetical protein [Dehalococcoidia bacterium]
MRQTETYTEQIAATRAFRWLVWGVVAVSVGIGAVVMVIEGDRWASALSIAFAVALLLVLDRWFMTLHVRVDSDGVVARFGPFSKRLRPSDIADVVGEPYRWMLYGGWGIRWGFGRRRAWTVPFLNQGVAVALQDGSRYFISSRQPERLRSAIVQTIEARGGTRG